MRLEKLEINGFKSFSDRSELAFDKGVTAIVGPNGCGKSNVSDAITWVMGEQSAKSLRGDKMEDVIFNGSDARKPSATAEVRLKFSGVVKSVSGPAFNPSSPIRRAAVAGADEGGGAAVAVAELESEGGVATAEMPIDDVPMDAGELVGNRIVFAPEEAEELIQTVAREVEVTRRLYRSGESEYLIDGHQCRLRDIHDLLMDTGLGAKAYAIIEQGKIGLILSTRPTDRRQLIEEAAGVTKYKMRRRAAELKLDAAQQNLTRIDDIVFEVEKQRGTLKRQAGKARKYKKLRDELRRWEKVLFARKYRQLAETIESARARLADAREREAAAAARVSEIESDFGRSRIELAEAESRATAAREVAHSAELAINRLQQQITFDGGQADSLEQRARTISQEIELLDARREPASLELDDRRVAAAMAVEARDQAAIALTAESQAQDAGHREITGLEAAVEAARREVYTAMNTSTALRHSLESAAAQHDRVLETLSKLQVEFEDVRIEFDRLEGDKTSAADGLRRAHEGLDATKVARGARESELASARIEHEWRARSVRSREHELAGLVARLKSLEELEAGRAEYGDAARTVLAEASGRVNPKGAVADYLEVEVGRERAVEAFLGELLQHIVVERQDHAFAGFELIREASAGRCGFVVVEGEPAQTASTSGAPLPNGFVTLSSVVRVNGPYGDVLRGAIGEAWLTDSYERAEAAAATAPCPIVTTEGEVFRGGHLVAGGHPKEARGILETKRDIKDLRARIEGERDALARLAAETADLERVISEATQAIAALGAEQHRQEKQIVALEAQLQRASEDATKVTLKGDQLARERRQAEEERASLQLRQEEARASIQTIEQDQRIAEEVLNEAQQALAFGRERAQDLARRAAEARAAHAALVERASALAIEVRRLEEAARELEERVTTLSAELAQTRQRVADLRQSVVRGEATLNDDIRALEELRTTDAMADDAVSTLRISTDQYEAAIRVARSEFESIRSLVSEYDLSRATAESDLSHLAATCLEAVQATLDEVMAEVEELERTGGAVPDARAILDDSDEATDEDGNPVAGAEVANADTAVADASPDTQAAVDAAAAAVAAAEQRTLSAEEAISTLRTKIERLGPVNMMAIEQHEELEARYEFLSTQRKDLVESIAQTSEAIRRIDETTKERFVEAFGAINRNFQVVFTTLFGGGRAGLTLLDENDPLESGIEIVAQPPGKRLQSVQLLSGGEKALTAISLMFGLFKYKPSPFCLLDEIDAPLDDANIGRFVEMLRSMQDHTQFILITHHRKTMEIADRLYGVTMEEPGVSKLISVQMN